MRTMSATWRTRCARSAAGILFMRRPNSIFSSTVLWGKSAWVWNTIPRPRSRGSRSFTTRPSMRISPAVGSSKPAIIRSVVVLPHPDGPTSTTNSPSSIAQLRFFTAPIPPKVLFRLTSSIRPSLSPNHPEAEATREMLADDEPDDHERDGNTYCERRLPAVDAALGRALIFRQLDWQRSDIGLGD